MAELRIYRTYSFVNKNPVIDRVRTIVQDEGLFKHLGTVHEISGVAEATLRAWFHGATRNPQHATIAAVITAMGYEETFTKTRKLDLAYEKAAAARWREAQESKRKKANGKKRR